MAACDSIGPMLLRNAVAFTRTRAILIVFISALVLVPCFWHRRIEAGDLPSHTYNAWLAHLIKKGQAPGLYIEWRWTNVLADIVLEKLGGVVGFIDAERVVVAMSVLLFFWGAFTFVSVANGRSPWFLTPAIAMITYGWTFYAGFLNFYISLGLTFFALALFWRGSRPDQLVGGLLGVLALLAHPLGFACLVSLAGYLVLAERLVGWKRWGL